MKHFFTTRLLACFAMLLVLLPSLVSASPFTPGNLVVVRIGDGSAVLTSGATATYLLEYTPAGVLVQTIALPTATAGTNSILTNTGTSGTDALLSRSADGAYLVLTGYDAAVGTAGLAATTSAANNRIIGRIAADGTFDTSTRLSDGFSGGNIRSATTVDGTNFYAVGSTGGVRYAALGNPASGTSTVISAVPSNNRGVGIYGGNLYVSSSTTTGGSFLGISQVGTGLPTTTGQTTTALPGFPTATGPSPYGFYFADLSTAVAGVDVVYVADDRTTVDGGVQKWSLVGGTWTLNGTITGATATTAGAAIRGLNGSVSGTTVTLAASSSTGLYLLTDNAGYNAMPSTLALPTPIATSITNTNFRGAAFAPVAAVVIPAPTITSFTPTSGAAGATVTITGTNLTGATAVTLNGVAITGFTVVNGTTITFTVPATATTGTIAVTTPGGTVTSTGTFTFVPAASAPTITSFTPTSGLVGATVTITGTNLTGATAVTLNGVAITGFTVVNATTITFAVPTGATSGTIAVTTPGGTATSTTSFTVTPAAVTPVITQLAPGVQVVGGAATTLVITGTGFTPTSTVNFNGVSYPQTTSTATSIEALIPASAFTTAGSFPVTVTNTAGTSNAFTFTVNNPTTAGAFEDFETGTKTGYAAASVVLASGSWTFSDALIGTAFNDRSNGLKSARIRVGFIRMDFDKPTGAGTVIVNAGTFGIDTGATFILEKSTDGGATFTTVPGAPATLTATVTPYTFTVNQAGNVRFRITSTATTTTQRINIDDISISNYTAPANPVPVITSITPSTATVGTAVFVTVTGTGFTTASVVNVDGNPFPSTFVSATQLTGTVPAGTPAGTYAVTVVNPTPGGGTSNPVTFRLVDPVPTITSFTPTTGGPGTVVTVTGTNLSGVTAVRIGSFNVPNFTGVSATTVTFVVPAGTGSVTGFISVVTGGGTATSTATFNLVSAVLASQALPGLSVFPNPATDRITVALPTAGVATVALRDLTGRLVLAPATLAADKQLVLPATLARGIYLLEVKQGDVSAVRRIEKN